MEQLGVDALDPAGALVDERLVETNLDAGFQDVGGRDPRLRDGPGAQELAQVAGVELVGFGPLLRAPQRGRVGGLGQVGLDPGGLKFLDHEPPPGAALDCERGRLTVELLKPLTELDSRRRADLAAVNLAGLGLHVVERDLLSVHVEPTYDRHSGPPRAPVLLAHRSLLRLTPRGPPPTCHLRAGRQRVTLLPAS